MSEVLLWLILAAVGLSAVLVGVLLVRFRTLEDIPKELREELRAGREEARRAGKELREEVSGSLQSTNEGLTKTLDIMGKFQQVQLEAMANQIKKSDRFEPESAGGRSRYIRHSREGVARG